MAAAMRGGPEAKSRSDDELDYVKGSDAWGEEKDG